MKIAILLPYKENFSPQYPGAVSLFVNETSKISKYKKDIVVFGSTDYKTKFNLKYINIKSRKNPFESQTKHYVKEFIKLQSLQDFSIIEIHNRPSYINILSKIGCQVIELIFPKCKVGIFAKGFSKKAFFFLKISNFFTTAFLFILCFFNISSTPIEFPIKYKEFLVA